MCVLCPYLESDNKLRVVQCQTCQSGDNIHKVHSKMCMQQFKKMNLKNIISLVTKLLELSIKYKEEFTRKFETC